MSLSASEKRALRRAAHALKARLVVGKAGLTEAVIAEVRTQLAATPLLKIRVDTDDRAQVEEYGARLVAEVPCLLVGRMGFTLTLTRPAEAPVEES